MGFFVGKRQSNGTPLLHIKTDNPSLSAIQGGPDANTIFHSDLPFIYAQETITVPLNLSSRPRTVPYWSDSSGARTENITEYFYTGSLSVELQGLLASKAFIMYFTLTNGYRVLAPITQNQYSASYSYPRFLLSSKTFTVAGSSGICYQFYNDFSNAAHNAGPNAASGSGYYEGATGIAVSCVDPMRGDSTIIMDKSVYLSYLNTVDWSTPIVYRSATEAAVSGHYPVSVTFQFINLQYNSSTESHTRVPPPSNTGVYIGGGSFNIGGIPLSTYKFLNYTTEVSYAQAGQTPVVSEPVFNGELLNLIEDNLNHLRYCIGDFRNMPIRKYHYTSNFNAFYGIKSPNLVAISDSLVTYQYPSNKHSFRLSPSQFDNYVRNLDTGNPVGNTINSSPGIFSILDPSVYTAQGYGWAIDNMGVYLVKGGHTVPVFSRGAKKYNNIDNIESIITLRNNPVPAYFSQIQFGDRNNDFPSRAFERKNEYIGTLGVYDRNRITGVLSLVSNILDDAGNPRRRGRTYTLLDMPKGTCKLIYQGIQDTMAWPYNNPPSIRSVSFVCLYLSFSNSGVLSVYRTVQGIQDARDRNKYNTELNRASTELDSLIRRKDPITCRVFDTTSLAERILFTLLE